MVLAGGRDPGVLDGGRAQRVGCQDSRVQSMAMAVYRSGYGGTSWCCARGRRAVPLLAVPVLALLAVIGSRNDRASRARCAAHRTTHFLHPLHHLLVFVLWPRATPLLPDADRQLTVCRLHVACTFTSTLESLYVICAVSSTVLHF